jgi:hypothetical protein
MFWLRSRIVHVAPPSSDRYSALRGGTASMNAYTTLGFDGATVTATRPHGLGGSPLAVDESSCFHVVPPSVLLNRPLPLGASEPSPPERNVQPLRRKSHMPAYSVLGDDGSMDIMEHRSRRCCRRAPSTRSCHRPSS